MGHWAKSLFGSETFGDVGIVVAGTNTRAFEQEVLSYFDEVTNRDHAIHAHLVKHNGNVYPIVFHVYGAAQMVHRIAQMYDGGCRTVIFVGYGYSRSLEVGTYVLPQKAYHYDGIYQHIDPERKFSIPDADLRAKVEHFLKHHDIAFEEGANISVPSVSLQLAHRMYKEEHLTVEMELASCLGRCHDLGMRAAGVLVVSDNRFEHLAGFEQRERRRAAKKELLRKLIGHMGDFHLPLLMNHPGTFDLDAYIANVVAESDNGSSAYRKKG